MWYPTPNLPPELAPPPPLPAPTLAKGSPGTSDKRLMGLEGREVTQEGQHITGEKNLGEGRRAQREGTRVILRTKLKDRIGASPNRCVELLIEGVQKYIFAPYCKMDHSFIGTFRCTMWQIEPTLVHVGLRQRRDQLFLGLVAGKVVSSV